MGKGRRGRVEEEEKSIYRTMQYCVIVLLQFNIIMIVIDYTDDNFLINDVGTPQVTCVVTVVNSFVILGVPLI